jgi:predicted enzyme related to lactoylglutathione lyase
MASMPSLGRIGQIAISVHDMGRAVRFWRDVVGLKFLFEAPNVAFFDCAGQRLMLSQADRPDLKPAGTVLYFDSEALEADFAAIKSRGATVAPNGEPHLVAPLGDKQLWMGFFSDPDGNLFALMQLR